MDRRAKDPNNPADITPSPAGRTVPQNPSAFKFRKYTFQVNVEVSKNSEPVCTSDTFHTETSAENPCSDVLKWEEPEMVICPFTKTPGYVHHFLLFSHREFNNIIKTRLTAVFTQMFTGCRKMRQLIDLFMTVSQNTFTTVRKKNHFVVPIFYTVQLKATVLL